MILLLLIDLGAASVKAQVRIGGNAAPNASAVLDLNVNDTNSGTKGLALPRVALTSNTMLLSGVTSNLTGMLVYNTSTTGGAGVNTIGIYFWNGATWVKANMPSTIAGDSGKVLMSDGSSVTLAPFTYTPNSPSTIDTVRINKNTPITWTLVVDTTFPAAFDILPRRYFTIIIPGLTGYDRCFSSGSAGGLIFVSGVGAAVGTSVHWSHFNKSSNIYLRCYRPSA